MKQLSWQDIIEEHGGVVWKVAYRLLGNEADTADCFQDVFLAAVKMSRREPIRNIPALMIRLTTTQAIDRLRRRTRETRVMQQLESTAPPHDHQTPITVVQKQEMHEAFRRALGHLPATQAEAFCLKHFQGLSQRQVGQALGMTANAAGVLIHRARQRLEEILSPSEERISEVQS